MTQKQRRHWLSHGFYDTVIVDDTLYRHLINLLGRSTLYLISKINKDLKTVVRKSIQPIIKDPWYPVEIQFYHLNYNK